MTFGYNAAAAFGNSMSDFEDHARDLLSSLVDRRQRDDEMQRPLIFIAHSLGGIIVKQALISARVDPKHQSINEHTIGIVFLGTPHRGSQTAAYASLLANIATFVMNVQRPSLLQALKLNSDELLKLTSNFRHELDKYNVVSFYERRRTGIGRVSTVVSVISV
jgi:triacylglycerol esterase/lipase EstA (alpha/beta hydrolase family)